MNYPKPLSGKDRYSFLCLAKAAGFTAKQAAPLCGSSLLRVSKIWKQIKVTTYPKTASRNVQLSVENKHLVVTLLLIGCDLFEVARTIGRSPSDILSFVERNPEVWRWISCRICDQLCITSDLQVRHCQKPSCVKMAREIRTREIEFDSPSRPKIGRSPLNSPLKFTHQFTSCDSGKQRKSRTNAEKHLHANA